jgi:hypothetical protein
MATNLPDDARALVDAREYATLATIEPDGRPQLSVVWITRDGDDLPAARSAGDCARQSPAPDPHVYGEDCGTAATSRPDPRPR